VKAAKQHDGKKAGTVSGILDRVEYLGHTENLKTASKNYRSNTGTCTAHYIRAVTLEKIVLAHMKRVMSYVQQFETTFVKREMEKADIKHYTSTEKAKVDIDKSSGHRKQKIEIYYNRWNYRHR